MIKALRAFFRRFGRSAGTHSDTNSGTNSGTKDGTMEHQHLTNITRGLQHAAAEANTLVAEQYIRILSQYFDHQSDGTLVAKMVKVQLTGTHHAHVPLVSLVTPTGLALDRMRVELSIKLEDAVAKKAQLFKNLRQKAKVASADDGIDRADFKVSLSPRTKFRGKLRPSDHVHIDLEFKALETPESVMRVIETYTNMIEPIPSGPQDSEPPSAGPSVGPTPPDPAPGGSGAAPTAAAAPGETAAVDDAAATVAATVAGAAVSTNEGERCPECGRDCACECSAKDQAAPTSDD